MICPDEKHARNKENRSCDIKGSVKHASNIFAYLLYIDKRNHSQKVIFTFKSRQTQQQQQQYLHHFSTSFGYTEWAKGSKQYCAIVNFDNDVPRKKYKFYDHVTRKEVQDGDVLRPRFFSSEKAERCSECN